MAGSVRGEQTLKSCLPAKLDLSWHDLTITFAVDVLAVTYEIMIWRWGGLVSAANFLRSAVQEKMPSVALMKDKFGGERERVWTRKGVHNSEIDLNIQQSVTRNRTLDMLFIKSSRRRLSPSTSRTFSEQRMPYNLSALRHFTLRHTVSTREFIISHPSGTCQCRYRRRTTAG